MQDARAARSTRGRTSPKRAGASAPRIRRRSASACCTRPASRCSPTSTSAAACRATASTSAFRTRRRTRRSRTASRGSTRSCAGTPHDARLQASADGDRRQRGVARGACSRACARALGRTRTATTRRALPRMRYLAAHGARDRGPRLPARPRAAVPRARDRHGEHRRARRHRSTMSPPAVARYAALRSSARVARTSPGSARRRVLAGVRRRSTGARRVCRSNRGRRSATIALGITGCFCAIAETGTLVFVTGTETPTATFLLPETHVAIVRVDQIVAGMEEAFARIRARARRNCRARSTSSRVLRAPATSSRRSCSARTGRAACTSCSWARPVSEMRFGR